MRQGMASANVLPLLSEVVRTWRRMIKKSATAERVKRN